MITYKDCPDCGMQIRANVSRCEICQTWAKAEESFAKAEEERDRAREQVAMLRRALKAYYHECRCQRAEMDEVNRQAYMALRATEEKNV